MTEITERLTTAIADRYRIESHLGQGGMAIVYLAHDTKHDRKVALKVLRPELAAVIGAERFLNEIKVTANLQHPHILPLHDSGEADSFLYYVMPYVEGDTLRDKLEREKQLGIEEAIEITRSVASALDYAHRHGVIHRDIKPENILIHDGQALIADFGIALAVSQAGGSRLTETGLSIGTPHYMSPEQAMGDRELDARSDVYSLGAMLYEMLAGDPPYTGSTAQAIVAKVITEKAPPVTATRDTVPSHVAAAIQKALSKLPADRFSTAAKLAEALANPAFTVQTIGEALPSAASGWRVRMAVPMAVAAAIFAIAAVAGWVRKPRQEPLPVVRFELVSQEIDAASVSDMTVSPDGSQIVFQVNQGGRSGLYVRSLDDLAATPLRIGEGTGESPFFSPNGLEVGFMRTTQAGQMARVRAVAAGGGPARTLADSAIFAAAWGDDGYVYFSAVRGHLARVPSGGGTVDTLVPADSGFNLSPRPLPGGRGVVFAVFRSAGSASQLAVLDLDTREWRPLIDGGPFTAYSSTGHLLFNRDRFLMAVPFDIERLTLTGPAVSVLEVPTGEFGAFAVGGRTLAYQSSLVGSGNAPVLVDRQGNRRLRLENLPEGQLFGFPAASPDGGKIAIRMNPVGLSESEMDVWVYELPAGPLTRLTFDGRDDDPSWTPDGSRILFNSDRGDNNALYLKPWDGSGEAELVLDRENILWRTSWLPDGLRFVFYERGPNSADVGLAQIGQPDSTRMLLTWSFDELRAVVSPDGRWLAYSSNESGQSEVYVRPLEGAGTRRQVSLQGGSTPVWSRGGAELFFVAGDSLYAAQMNTAGDISIEQINALFPMQWANLGYDVMPGDSLFVAFQAVGEETGATPVVVVHNFTTELEARLARGGR